MNALVNKGVTFPARSLFQICTIVKLCVALVFVSMDTPSSFRCPTPCAWGGLQGRSRQHLKESEEHHQVLEAECSRLRPEARPPPTHREVAVITWPAWHWCTLQTGVREPPNGSCNHKHPEGPCPGWPRGTVLLAQMQRRDHLGAGLADPAGCFGETCLSLITTVSTTEGDAQCSCLAGNPVCPDLWLCSTTAPLELLEASKTLKAENNLNVHEWAEG